MADGSDEHIEPAPLRVSVEDDKGVRHAGTLGRLGPAFAEIDLTDGATTLRPDDAVRLSVPGVSMDRMARVVRSGPHLVVQLAAARERRTHLRVPFRRPLRWRPGPGSSWESARGEDLSSAGVRMTTDTDPGLGAEIAVELPMLGRTSVEVRAEVLAVAELGRWFRVRCRFVDGRSPAVVDVIGHAVHSLHLE